MTRIILFWEKRRRRVEGWASERECSENEHKNAVRRGVLEMNRSRKGRGMMGNVRIRVSNVSGVVLQDSLSFTLELLVFNKYCITEMMKVGRLFTKDSCGSRRAPSHKAWDSPCYLHCGLLCRMFSINSGPLFPQTAMRVLDF